MFLDYFVTYRELIVCLKNVWFQTSWTVVMSFTLGLFKICLKMLKSPSRKKKFFFENVSRCIISSWKCFHKHDISSWSMWLLMWKRHLGQYIVKSVENISRTTENHRTFAKKEPQFCWSPVKDINISDTIYKIQNLN